MSVLRRLWHGKYPLPATFWGFYCAGLFACFVLAGMIMVLGRYLSLGGFASARRIAFGIGRALTYGYLLVATVAVWRSAGPYWTSPIWMRRIWAGAARFWVIAWIANIAINLANGGALAIVHWVSGDVEW